MPLYLSGFLRQHAALAPRLVRRQNTHVDLDPATPQRIGHHTDRDLTRCRVNTSAPEYSTQSRHTALTAFRLAVCSEGRRAGRNRGIPGQVDRGRAARARTPPQPAGAAALLTNCRDMRYIILCPRVSRGCRVQAAPGQGCSTNGPRPGGTSQKTGLRSRRHHQHHGSPAPDQLERHEPPNPVRSNAVEPRFHCVRRASGRRRAGAGSPSRRRQPPEKLSPPREPRPENPAPRTRPREAQPAPKSSPRARELSRPDPAAPAVRS